MNSRYNIGKIIYKVDAFVDQSQKTIITDNVSTKTIFIDSYLSLGKDNDLKNIIMKQDVDEETWETKDAILYAPYINIGKELIYDGQYKTIINDEGLYTDKLNLNNFTTHTIKIVNDNDDVIINLDELGIKLNNKLLTDITSGTITETDNNKIIATKKYVDDQVIHAGNVGKFYPNSTFGEYFNDYNNNIASGDYSHAEGYNTNASGKYSHTSGYHTIADQNYMFSIGKFNKDTNNDNKLFVVGNGINNSNRNDAFVIYNNGNVYCDNTLNIKSLNLNDKLINDITYEDGGDDDKVLATKYYVDNHGGGSGSGVGEKTNEHGGERFNDYVSNTAEGYYTHAEGYNTHAIGDYSHSSGYNTIANSNYMSVVGKFNKISELEHYLFIVGNGTDNDNRSNALIVDINGNTIIKNNLSSNNLNITNNANINNLTSSSLSSTNANITTLTTDTFNTTNLTTDNLILNNKLINDIEKMNDATENDNKIPTLSKVNNLIATASIDLSNYEDLVKITNINNELTAKQITLNNKLITNTTASNLEVSENDNTILATKKYVDDHQPDLSSCVKNNIDQTLLNKFVFNNNSNEFTGSSLTTTNLTINNKFINDIEKVNDSSANDSKLASFAKINDILLNYINKTDNQELTNQFYFNNDNNKFKGQQIILNNKEINQLITTGNSEINDDKIYSQSKIDEINEDFVSKTTNNIQTVNGQLNLPNENNEIKMFKMYLPILN